MPISTQDLTHGVDFTTLSPNQTASEHNQLVDQSIPTNDGDDTIGRALIITSTDTAVGVPSVPNANTYTKWKRYLWARRPNPADTTEVSILYTWNDAATPDATLLNWVPAIQDLTAIEAQIAQAESDAATALSTANAANGNASQALTNSQQALNTANSANSTAQTALSTANTATSAAAIASANASAAQVTASAALAAATAPESITNIVIGTFPGQRIRSNSANTQLEYYKIIDEIVRIVYQDTFNKRASSIQSLPPLTTLQRIPITVVYNSKTSDTGGLCTLNTVTGQITLQPGVYKVKAKHRYAISITGSAPIFTQVDLIKDSDNTVLISGITLDGDTTEREATTEGLLTITTASGPLTVRFDIVALVLNINTTISYTSNLTFGSSPYNEALYPTVLNNYASIEFERIGFQ